MQPKRADEMAQQSASKDALSAKSLSEKISDIIADHLKSGERFPTESQLMRDLSVSRSALREALSAFEAKGIITAQRGSGRFVRMPDLSATLVDTWSFVLKVDPNLMLDFLEIRCSLELNSLSKAMERCTVDQLTQMSRLVESMKQLTEDSKAFARIDCEFHKAMFLTSATGCSSSCSARSATFSGSTTSTRAATTISKLQSSIRTSWRLSPSRIWLR